MKRGLGLRAQAGFMVPVQGRSFSSYLCSPVLGVRNWPRAGVGARGGRASWDTDEDNHTPPFQGEPHPAGEGGDLRPVRFEVLINPLDWTL